MVTGSGYMTISMLFSQSDMNVKVTASIHVHVHAITIGTNLTDYHSHMMNVTARLAVRIRYLPDFPFEWSDTQPQRSHQSLTIDDFLPSKDDALELQHGIQYLMEFLVENFTDLAHLQKFVPPVEPIHPPEKTEVVPMIILFKDEKLKSDTIDILSQLITDANLDGTPQVHLHVYVSVYI